MGRTGTSGNGKKSQGQHPESRQEGNTRTPAPEKKQDTRGKLTAAALAALMGLATLMGLAAIFAPTMDGLSEMPEASDLPSALTRAHEENPVRSRMEQMGETVQATGQVYRVN